MKNFDHLPFNWFDVLLVLVLVLGLYRGRKRGMSTEIFTLLQWILVIFACAFGYEPLGKLLASVVPFGLLTCYLISYITIGLLVSVLVVALTRGLGPKLVERDTFGTAEYYLGMPAGLIRFACVFLTLLAVLNARYFTTAEIRAREVYQLDMYGSDFFPGLSNLQRDVFQNSLFGPSIKKYASFMLIKPTPPGSGQAAAPQQRAAARP